MSNLLKFGFSTNKSSSKVKRKGTEKSKQEYEKSKRKRVFYPKWRDDFQDSPDLSGKREAQDDGPSAKKSKTEVQEQQQPREDRKRKVALLLSYNGKGYHGIQVNPGFATIESELCKALLEVGLIPQQHHDCMQKMSFQRAARTDKGVSAAGNVVSLKMLLNVDNLLEKVNEKLPPQIRVMDCLRTTNGFNCKNMCDARTYVYVLPTYAFSPKDQPNTLDYRCPQEVLQKVRTVLEGYLGTHNFHNFTSGMKPTDGAAKRYIMKFECGQPFVRDDVEFCVLSVKGQSFMLHQIRKMIGLAIAIVKGFCDISAMEETWKHEKFDVPKAPGLGLILDQLHYQRYNRLYAEDGSHKKIDFSHIAEKLAKFKEEQIFSEIIKEEIEEKSMMTWLQTLYNHSFTSGDVWEGKQRDQEQNDNQESARRRDNKKPCRKQELMFNKDTTQSSSGPAMTGSGNADCVSEKLEIKSPFKATDCVTNKSEDLSRGVPVDCVTNISQNSAASKEASSNNVERVLENSSHGSNSNIAKTQDNAKTDETTSEAVSESKQS